MFVTPVRAFTASVQVYERMEHDPDLDETVENMSPQLLDSY